MKTQITAFFYGVGHVSLHPVPGKNLGRKSTAVAAGVSAAYRAACRRDLGIGRISYRAFRKTSGRLRRDLSRASVSAHRLYSPGRLHGLLRRDLVPAGFSDTAENFKGLACRIVCRRVTIFLMLAMFAAFRDFDIKNGFPGLILLPVFSRFASSFCVFACRPMQTSQYASGF